MLALQVAGLIAIIPGHSVRFTLTDAGRAEIARAAQPAAIAEPVTAQAFEGNGFAPVPAPEWMSRDMPEADVQSLKQELAQARVTIDALRSALSSIRDMTTIRQSLSTGSNPLLLRIHDTATNALNASRIVVE